MSPEMKAYRDAYFRFLNEIPKTIQRIADVLSTCPEAWQTSADEPAIRRNREANR